MSTNLISDLSIWSNFPILHNMQSDIIFSNPSENDEKVTISFKPKVKANFILPEFLCFSFIGKHDANIEIYLTDKRVRKFNSRLFLFDDTVGVPCSFMGITDAELSEIRIHSKDPLTLRNIYFSDNNIQFSTIKLKINLHSGIGDCLRTISVHNSLSRFINHFDCRVFWTYAANGLRDSRWADLLKNFIFGRINKFEYLDNAAYNSLDIPELYNGYSGSISLSSFGEDDKQGLDIPLKEPELSEVNSIFMDNCFNVGMQLEGNDPKKKWPIENYVKLINYITEKIPNSHIYIIDAPNRNFPIEGYDLAKVTSLIGVTNISQNINLIKKMNLWISPDSFSKYITNWGYGSQIILCCELPYITPRDMLLYCFDNVGLCNNPKTRIIGLDYDLNLNVSNCVQDIAHINFEDLAKAINDILKIDSNA